MLSKNVKIQRNWFTKVKNAPCVNEMKQLLTAPTSHSAAEHEELLQLIQEVIFAS